MFWAATISCLDYCRLPHRSSCFYPNTPTVSSLYSCQNDPFKTKSEVSPLFKPCHGSPSLLELKPKPFQWYKALHDLTSCATLLPSPPVILPTVHSSRPLKVPWSHKTTTRTPLRAFAFPVLLAWKAFIPNIHSVNSLNSFKSLFKDHFSVRPTLSTLLNIAEGRKEGKQGGRNSPSVNSSHLAKTVEESTSTRGSIFPWENGTGD